MIIIHIKSFKQDKNANSLWVAFGLSPTCVSWMKYNMDDPYLTLFFTTISSNLHDRPNIHNMKLSWRAVIQLPRRQLKLIISGWKCSVAMANKSRARCQQLPGQLTLKNGGEKEGFLFRGFMGKTLPPPNWGRWNGIMRYQKLDVPMTHTYTHIIYM